jgi:formylglycine-generating enzyme required for sulfatase activity
VDATATGTEDRLHEQLRRVVPALAGAVGLVESLSILRRAAGRKVVIFLDQFEQWLSGNMAGADSDLVLALRQCDGAHLQAVLMIRDDFALSAGRFMRLVESRLVEGWNFAAVDLFDTEHTERVLGMFGRAYGRLPERADQLTQPQAEFLRSAAQLLARDGRVVSVHVAVFAEMMRRRVWIPESLQAVGGAEGVGVSFLEQMFCGRESNPEYRLHAEAAQRVLKSMLPGVDREIRGVRRTLSELREASCYAGRSEEFAELLRILEQELRLVTVTESGGSETSVVGGNSSEEVCYQLTHDFLVPALRSWLSQKQRETVEGRVELMLEDRAATWKARQENRYLPSLWEWLEILRRTDRRRWLEGQRRMMQVAGRWHLRRSVTVLSVLLASLLCGLFVYRRAESAVRQREMIDLVQGLRDARAAVVPTDIELLKQRAEYAVPELRRQLLLVQAGTDQQLNLAAGLVALGEEVDEELLSAIEKLLLASRLEQLPVMSGIFRALSERLRPGLLGVLSSVSESPARRLNAACLISSWLVGGGDAEAESALGSAVEFLALEVVKQRPLDVPALQELLQPAFPQLLPVLTRMHSGKTLGPLQRAVALGVLADAVREDAAALVDLVLQSGEESFGVLLPSLERLSDGVVKRLRSVLTEKPMGQWDEEPLGASWEEMTAVLRRELESCGGVVNDRSAMCLSLPFDRFLEIAEELRVCGYRPVRVRQVETEGGGPARVSAVWRRDGREWRLQAGLQVEQLPGAEEDAVLDGLVPEEVSHFSGKGVTGGWLVLWSEPVESGERRRFVAGLTGAELRAVERSYSEGEFGLQLSLSVYPDEMGVRRYGAVFSSQKVWSRSLTAYSGYEVLEIPQRDCAVASTGYEVSEDPREKYRRQLRSLQGLSAAAQATAEFRQMRAEVFFGAGDPVKAVSDLDAVMSPAFVPRPELLVQYLTLLSQAGRAEDAVVVMERLEKAGPAEEVLAAGRVMTAAAGVDAGVVLTAIDRAEELSAGNGRRLFELSEYAALSAQALRRREPAVDAAAVLDRAFVLLRAAVAAGFNRGIDLATSTPWAEYREDVRMREVLSSLRQRDVLAGLWFADAGLESRLVRGNTVPRVQEEAVALCADGWRPVSAGLSTVGGGDCVVLLQRPIVKPELVEAVARRQALAQLLLLRLGAAEDVWQVLEDRPDPRVRTGVLHGLSAAGVSAETLLRRLSQERSVGIRRGLIQGLGELVLEGGVAEDLRQRIVADLLVRLVGDPDPGVHAMCHWTLQKCGAGGEAAASLSSLATGRLEGGRGWYLTGTKGDTAESRPHILAIVDGRSDFLIGSPLWEVGRLGADKPPNQEPLHRRRLKRRFAIGMFEVDVSQFRAFRGNHAGSAEFSRSDADPANRVTWYAAAEFCNWLSAQEGIPEDQWCYDPGQLFASGMALKPGFTELSGYRLPTSVEWELACRAGTTTSRYFGETTQFLSSYAWWNGNMDEATLKPCGQLRPNPFGLSDVYGNVNEWVSDEGVPAPFAMENTDINEPTGIPRVSDLRLRMCRGASFGDVAGANRSAAVSARQPGILSGQQGFRVVRTVPADWPE